MLFAADVVDETTADLTAWSSDDFQTIHTTAGQLELTDDRSQLVIFPNDPPFMILGCTFVRYDGEYIGSTRAANSAGRCIRRGPQRSTACAPGASVRCRS